MPSRTLVASWALRVAACALPVLLTATAHAQGHVTCVGDSITVGGGASSAATAYPAVLQRMLGGDFAVENDGRSGATMMKVADLSYWSTAELSRSSVWAAAGGDVVIQLGTNDSWPSNWSKRAAFLGDCEALVNHYLVAKGHPRVWVSLIPPCSMDDGVIAKEIVPLLRTCAAETGVSSIDVFGALRRHPDYFVDGVHPDDRGAALIARTVHDALVKRPTISLYATSTSTSPAAVTLTAAPTAAYGKVEKVVFFEGDVVLAERRERPWVVTIGTVPAGSHVYRAMVVETAGRTTSSAPTTALVSGGAPPEAERIGWAGIQIAMFGVVAVTASSLVIRRRRIVARPSRR